MNCHIQYSIPKSIGHSIRYIIDSDSDSDNDSDSDKNKY